MSAFLHPACHKLYRQEVFHMKESPIINFTFVNPNSPAAFETALKRILLEKLLAEFAYPEYLPIVG